ncbi:MAG TPA: putative 2OG-Fe(II) oxygenase, partial [Sphingomicrobium sp.]
RQLRSAIVGAVERHIAQLPPTDPAHPTLRRRRDRRVRFSGSWSVRLRSGGHHANHVHPLGWLSSALYIALPARGRDEPEDAGWLTLGQPDEKLGIDLPPWRKIEPKVAQLVLFPSTMWHGTMPFEDGERLTVAFDVEAPR